MGLDAFNTTREYTDFDEKKIGFGVNTSYPLKDFRMPFFGGARSADTRGRTSCRAMRRSAMWDYARGGVSYGLTHEKIGNIDPAAAPDAIQDEKGTSLTSSVTPEFLL